MSRSGRLKPWKFIGVAVAVGAILVGGEVLLTLLEELVELLVDVLHTGFMVLFEKGFGLPYEKAQGRAAWVSVGLVIVLFLFGVWRVAPWLKRILGEFRQELRGARDRSVESWRSARWYQKLLYAVGGLIVLSGVVMII